MADETLSAPRATFRFECLDAQGQVKWVDGFSNVVVAAGKQDLLNVYFGATAKPAGWYLVLAGSGTKSSLDTLGSHAGWTEQTTLYSAANRPTVTFGTASIIAISDATVDDARITTSAAVSVAITGSGTIAGAGLTQTQVKATTTGVLYNAGDFAAPRTVASGDTVQVSLQLDIT